MRLLLDTHVLIWWSGDLEQISDRTRATILDADEVLVSPVSAYEMALKHQLGRLPGVADLLSDLSGYLSAQAFSVLPIGLAHAELAGRLPVVHRDPFDRLIAAQAQIEQVALVSGDTVFDAFGVRRLW